jgi:hypothetical protein
MRKIILIISLAYIWGCYDATVRERSKKPIIAKDGSLDTKEDPQTKDQDTQEVPPKDPFKSLCKPCENDNDCKEEEKRYHCLSLTRVPGGKFCFLWCGSSYNPQSNLCPKKYKCASVKTKGYSICYPASYKCICKPKCPSGFECQAGECILKDPEDMGAIERALLRKIQNERENKDDCNIRRSDDLDELAKDHSTWMENKGECTADQNGQDIVDRADARGISYQSISQIEECDESDLEGIWKKIKGKSQITNCAYKKIGIGAQKGDDDNIYTTLVFVEP